MTGSQRSASVAVVGTRRPGWRTVGTAAALIVSGVVLSGCVAATSSVGSRSPVDSPSPIASPSASVVPPASPSATPAATPAFLPDGTAADNLIFFNLVNQKFLGPNLAPGGRPIIDSLVAAGFDKTAMQVTPDVTPIGRPVDSVQFSVRIDDACLIGQTSAAGYIGIVGPAVSATSCLAGTTRAIDW